MTQWLLFEFLLLLFTLGGFYIAYLYGHKVKRFRWSEYIALLILPTLFVFISAYYIDRKILIFFILSSAAGFFMEYMIGLAFHKTLNRKLWRYERLSVGEYTSLLSIPVWGIAGVMFYFLSKIIGL